MDDTLPPHIYHGTSARKLRAILKHGIVPRGARKSLWPDMPSRHDHVYLSATYAIHYAKNASEVGDAALIRIDLDMLDHGNLYADEDALEQANRENDKDRWPTMKERTMFYRDSWATLPIARNWQGSLAMLGNCSHEGTIPLAAISGVAIVKRGSALWHLCDPTISALNFRLLAGYYRALSAFPWDGPAAAQAEECMVPSYLDNLKQVPAGLGCRAYTRPLPIRRIVASTERRAA